VKKIIEKVKLVRWWDTALAALVFFATVVVFLAAGCSSAQLQSVEATVRAKVGAAADNVKAVAVAVDTHEATIEDLATAAEGLAVAVSSSSPQAAVDLRALAGAARQVPGVSSQVSAYASVVKAALK